MVLCIKSYFTKQETLIKTLEDPSTYQTSFPNSDHLPPLPRPQTIRRADMYLFFSQRVSGQDEPNPAI